MPISIALTTSIVVITCIILRVVIGLRRRKFQDVKGDIAVSIESPGGRKRQLRVIPDDIRSVDTLILEFSQSVKQKSGSHLK
jgi:hypothetical protein